MDARKASRKAASRSLDGHVRFVVAIGRSMHVFDLVAVATCARRIDLIAAYSAGRCISLRTY